MNIVDRIIELYGPKLLRKSAMNIRHGAGVFEKVMSGKRYRTALEIGTFRGVAAAEMAQYCDKVITIDLAYGKLEGSGIIWDREAFWKSIGVTNVEFHAVVNDAEKKQFVDSLEFDFAFIDGAHDITVRNDFALVKRCGHVLFHDADDNGPHTSNCVYEFISTLPKNEVEFIDIFALWERKALPVDLIDEMVKFA